MIPGRRAEPEQGGDEDEVARHGPPELVRDDRPDQPDEEETEPDAAEPGGCLLSSEGEMLAASDGALKGRQAGQDGGWGRVGGHRIADDTGTLRWRQPRTIAIDTNGFRWT